MQKAEEHSHIPDVAEYRDLIAKAKVLEFSFTLPGTYLDLIRYTGQVDLFNKLAGNKPVVYTFQKHEKGGTINLAVTKKAGLPLRPLAYIKLEYRFVERDGKTVAYSILHYTSRSFQFLADFVAKKLFILFKDTITKISNLQKPDDVLAISPFQEKDPALQMELPEIKKIFTGLHSNQDLIDKIIKFLAYAPDKHVSRIRPLHVAAHFHLSENELIEFFLRATRKGLFDMSWDILCPSCRGDKFKADNLSLLSKSAHCDYCDIPYDASFSENVELTFRPSGKIRKVAHKAYCVNSPLNTPHIYSQVNAWPDQAFQSEFYFRETNYRMGMIGESFQRRVIIDSKNGKDQIEIRIPEDFKNPEPLVLKPKPKITFYNEYNSNYPVTVKFITDTYRDYALLASRVTAMQEFRDLFSSEVLAPGLELGVENLTFMFTDLKDSTPMYEEMGDAQAFALVRDHFDLLTTEIRNHNGAVVKTIGDAVMAVFQTVGEAQSSGSAILTRMKAKFPNIMVKIGIYNGACLAVTSNEKLDYFGSTVNKAARIQGLANGNDIVMEETTENATHFPQTTFLRETFRSKLKGISGEVGLVRYKLKD